MDSPNQGPIDKIYEALEDVPDTRTVEEIRAELVARGFNPDQTVQRLQSLIHGRLKEERLAWKVQAAQKKSAFEQAKQALKSWVTASEAEIERAFETWAGGGTSASVAFRNKANLSIQDKARLLDSLHILRDQDSSAEGK